MNFNTIITKPNYFAVVSVKFYLNDPERFSLTRLQLKKKSKQKAPIFLLSRSVLRLLIFHH